jgi:hypothetical protein
VSLLSQIVAEHPAINGIWRATSQMNPRRSQATTKHRHSFAACAAQTSNAGIAEIVAAAQPSDIPNGFALTLLSGLGAPTDLRSVSVNPSGLHQDVGSMQQAQVGHCRAVLRLLSPSGVGALQHNTPAIHFEIAGK